MATNWKYVPVVGDFRATRGNPPNFTAGFLLTNNAGDVIPRDLTTAIFQGAPRPSALKTAFALFNASEPSGDDATIFVNVVSPRIPDAIEVANEGNSFSPLVSIQNGPGAQAQVPYLDSVQLTADSPIVKLGFKIGTPGAGGIQLVLTVDFSHSVE